MRYLQYNTLQRLGLGQFDSWAATFGETQTAIELAPEGTGYRAKTRFAKFFNLPELLALFKECADIQTADMQNLPVPEAEYENVVLKFWYCVGRKRRSRRDGMVKESRRLLTGDWDIRKDILIHCLQKRPIRRESRE